ncbi:MAG: 50S ribosomal protein L4 [Candidatus Aenigmarchaeota archaeon]|nr:50S ribosomal protein L4 [Candidatus Aenigmarchaeota archaeon]
MNFSASAFQEKRAVVYDLSGNVKEEIKLPEIFSAAYRPEVIKRAVLANQSARRQKYGTDPMAGKKSSAHYHGKRKYRWSMMNKEMARIARIHGKVGYMAMRARVVPQAVKGRAAHPPKADKNWIQKINEKENMLAIKSALAATANKILVTSRGHVFGNETPVIVVDEFEHVSKAKEVEKLLEKIIGEKELQRAENKKVRAGIGKMRGRKYKRKKGVLIISSKKCDMLKAARNIAGIDVVDADNIDIELLAPGTHAGRLAVITKSAVEKLNEKYGK